MFRQFSCALLASLLVLAPARASNEGKMCEGFGILLCAPLAVAIGVSKALTPKTPNELLYDAVRDGDLEAVKRLAASKDGQPEHEHMLWAAADAYLSNPDPAKDAARLAIIDYLAGNVIDVRGDKAGKILQMTARHYGYSIDPPERHWPQRLALAELLLRHGASASAVNLSECDRCAPDYGYLALMVGHGADPNRTSDINPALLNQMLRNDAFDAAAHLVSLGADPNGSVWAKRAMLVRMAEECDPARMRLRFAAERLEQERASCTAKVTARVSFAISLGADPNGQASPATDCLTPLDVALKAGNAMLAAELRKLGADPEFGAVCRAKG